METEGEARMNPLRHSTRVNMSVSDWMPGCPMRKTVETAGKPSKPKCFPPNLHLLHRIHP